MNKHNLHLIKYFKKTSKEIRRKILLISNLAKSSHIGSSLSIVDLLVVIYKSYLKKNIFILSKGHACLAYYCVLEKYNYISKKILNTYGKDNSILLSHVSHKVPGVEFSTGSLGHGLPFAVGRALAEKMNKTNKKIFVLISDGELNEGTTWESLLFASFHNLNNLIVIIDYNKIQSLDYTKNVLQIEPLDKKLKSFGCKIKNIDGHNFRQIQNSLSASSKNKPYIIIANTIKGKGVKFMENSVLWHYKSPSNQELKNALNNLK
jgi:transketolase